MAPSSGQLYKVRLSTGRIVGPIDSERVRGLILKKHITGTEEAREHPNGDWRLITTIPELAELFLHQAPTSSSAPPVKVDFVGATQVLPKTQPLTVPSLSSPSLEISQEPAEPADEEECTVMTSHGSQPESADPAAEEEDRTRVGESEPHSSDLVLSGQPYELEDYVKKPVEPSGVSQEKTVIFQRSIQSPSIPGKRQGAWFKYVKMAAVAAALWLVFSEIFDPGTLEPQKKAHFVPVRPTLPQYVEGQTDPVASAKLYDEGMKFYVQDTVPGYKEAARRFLKSASLDSGNVKALALLASSYLNLIDSSNKDENYFSVISKLIELSRAKNIDLPETVIADVEYFVTANKPEAAQTRVVEYTKTHKNYGIEMFFYFAYAFYGRGDAASAARYLGQIPDNRVFSARVFYLRGLIAEKLNDTGSAQLEYKKAIKMNPQHAHSMLRIAAILYAENKLPLAGPYLDAIAANPDLLPPKELAFAYFLAAKQNQSQNKFDLALGNIERALRLDSDNSEYNLEFFVLRAKAGELIPAIQKEARMYYFLGEGEKLVKLGKYQDALVQFMSARQARLNSPLPLIKMGDMFVYLKDMMSARLNYKKAAEMEPKNIQIWSKYIDSLIHSYEWEEAQAAMDKFRKLPVPQSSIDKAAADWYAKQGMHVEAQVFYRKAMARDTIDPGVYIAYAKSLMATKNFKDAPFFFALALRFDPLNIEALTGTAKCIAATEGIDRGIAMLQDELQKGGSSRAELLAAIAELQIQKGHWDKAQQYVDQALAANHDYALSWKLQAQIYMNNESTDPKAIDRALEAYKSYSDRNPSDPSGYLERYRLFAKKTNFERANEELDRIYALYPRYPNLHFHKGKLYALMGNHKASVAELLQELKNSTNSVTTLIALGQEYIELADPKTATDYLSRAMRLAPQNAESRHLAGYANYLLKNYQAATALYREALRFDTGNPILYKRMGFAYREMGDSQNARMAFRKYLEMEPDAYDKAEFERY